MGSGHQPKHVMEALLALLAEAPELRMGQAIALATHPAGGISGDGEQPGGRIPSWRERGAMVIISL
jgi:hypothetical protein